MTLKRKTLSLSFALTLAAMSTFARADMVPKGWVKAGSAPRLYEVELLTDSGRGSAVLLRSRRSVLTADVESAPANPFGTVMQTISSAAYAGKRLRLTASVQADGVRGWAGLWMRVDGALGKVLAFDNMEKHPIKGSSAATKYSVVLDVPANAQAVSYGILLDGEGSVILQGNVRVETVGKDVPVTSGPETGPLPTKPQNLDFSE